MEPAKLIIEVSGGDGVDEPSVDAPQPPGSRPETPRSPAVPPVNFPRPPAPAAPPAYERTPPAPEYKPLNLDLNGKKDPDREEFIPQPPPPRPPQPTADGPPPGSSSSAPAQDPDEWYPRYRELQNRLDMGGNLKDEEIEELRRLTEAMRNLTDAMPTAGSPMPAPERPPPPPAPEREPALAPGPPPPRPPEPPPPPPPPPAPPAAPEPPDDDEPEPAPRPPQPPPPLPPRPDDKDLTYDLADEPPRTYNVKPDDDTYKVRPPTAYPVQDEPEERLPLAGDTYEAQPPPPKPPRPPGSPRPRAEVISDADKSRDQWTPEGALDDLKGYIPFGIGNKFGSKFKVMGSAYSAASGEAAAAGASRVGAMAAGAGEAALAAGPAAVIAAMYLAGKAYESTLTYLGDRATQIAGNDHGELLADGASAARIGLLALGPAGMAASAALTLATPVVKEFAKVAGAFVERGKYLATYNSTLGAANAVANVRSTLADVRESQALAPSISRTTDNMSQMDTGLRDLMLPIKQGLSEILAAGTDIGKEVITLLKEFAPLIKFGVQLASAMPVATLKLIAEIVAMFRKALEKWPFNVKFDVEGGDLNSLLNDFLNSADRISGPYAPGTRPFAPGQAGVIFGRN